MEIIAILPIIIGIWLKLKDDNLDKYRRTMVVNIIGFIITACIALFYNFHRTLEISSRVCASGFGPGLILLAIYRSYRTFKGQHQSLGCFAPIALYFQFMLMLVVSIMFVPLTLQDSAVGTITLTLIFLGLMASLGVFHAWAGPILAGFTLSAGLVGLLSGKGGFLFWAQIFEWLNLGTYTQWLWMVISTVMSISGYWGTLFDQDKLDQLVEKLTQGGS